MRIAPLDAARRSAVQAAILPHLNSEDSTLRLACVRAFVHWATAKDVPTLVGIAALPEARGGKDSIWGSAVVGLVRIAPLEARRAYFNRKSEFFFRVGTTRELLTLAEQEPQYAATALQMIRECDPQNRQIKLSLPQAMQMLQSDAASVRAKACETLMVEPIDPAQQNRVLALLEPHVNAADGFSRTKYVRAYAHWADVAHVKGLQSIVDFPKTDSRDAHGWSWAAATVAMFRLGAVQAGIDGYNARVKARDAAFQMDFNSRMHVLAESTGPQQTLAWAMLEQLKDGRMEQLHPLDARGEQPAASAPKAPTPPSPESPGATSVPVPAGALHGQIRGKSFVPDRFEMSNGTLTFRSGAGFFADKQISISLHIRPGEAISGRTYHVQLDDRQKPGVSVTRMQPGDKLPQFLPVERYRMDLEFGKLADDRLPGKIKLVVEDEQGIDLTGSFVADFK